MQVFGRYRLRKLLGRGGMGIVWLAQDERLERDVALKLLPEMLFLDAAARDDLKRETRKSLELTHANIVRIYDFIEDDQAAAISMEYVDGATLSHLRVEKAAKVFETDELACWLPGLCSALGYAHESARLVHRDLKPANIMLTSRGALKVADFGIACSLMNSVNRISMAAGSGGTLAYMSPQQMQGDPASALDDIYALGATIYELLTSRPPFHSGNLTLQVREVVPESLARRRDALGITGKTIPAAWEKVVAACLAKDPAKRPQHATEIPHWLGITAPTAPVEILTSKTIIPANYRAAASSRLLKYAVPVFTGIALLAGSVSFHHAANKSPAPISTMAAPATVSAGRGGLIVKTSPPGATVTIGGDAVETTPATFKGVPAGKYPLQIMLDGYEPVDMQTEIVASKFGDLGTIALTRSVGAVQLITTPPGSDFEISQQGTVLRSGQTPQTIAKLPTGSYSITIKRAGWPNFSREVKVERNATQVVEWEFGQGALALTSEPSGANVFVDGRLLGQTPLSAQLPAGTYKSIRLALDRYKVASIDAIVEQGKTTTPDPVLLAPCTGRIEVTSVPDGAEIFLDKVAIGVAPLSLDVPIGAHELTAHHAGFPERKHSVSIALDETETVQFAMRASSASHTHRKTPPPSTWNKIGQTLKNVFKR